MKRLVLLTMLVVELMAPSMAGAQDPYSGLSSAEADAASARTEIAAAEADVNAAQSELAPVAQRAEQASARAEAALKRVDQLEQEVIERRVEAAEEVAETHADHQVAVADHNDGRDDAIGIAIGLLILSLLALGWERFRAIPVIEWLADQRVLRAALFIGAGFLLLVTIGAALLEGARIAGSAVLTLAVGLLIAVVVARHSLLRERGQAQAILSRERLPRKASLVLAVVLALAFVGTLGGAIAGDPPAEPEIAPRLGQLAEQAEGEPADPPTAAMRRAAASARPLIRQANSLDDARQAAQQRVNQAKNALLTANRRLSEAEQRARQFTRLIARQEAAAAREAERQAAIAEREAREAAEEAEAAQPVYGGGGGGGDLDCADLGTDIPVPPGDPNGLDGDGDGIGCES